MVLGSALNFSFVIGTLASAKMEVVYGEDPPIVVIDEFVGMWISLLWLPKSIVLSFIAFVLFRLFDIFKPPPARQLEALRNGFGIMLDDVAAGIYANMVLQAALYVMPSLRSAF
jgi:phosphatidylglycerophosphatase A